MVFREVVRSFQRYLLVLSVFAGSIACGQNPDDAYISRLDAFRVSQSNLGKSEDATQPFEESKAWLEKNPNKALLLKILKDEKSTPERKSTAAEVLQFSIPHSEFEALLPDLTKSVSKEMSAYLYSCAIGPIPYAKPSDAVVKEYFAFLEASPTLDDLAGRVFVINTPALRKLTGLCDAIQNRLSKEVVAKDSKKKVTPESIKRRCAAMGICTDQFAEKPVAAKK